MTAPTDNHSRARHPINFEFDANYSRSDFIAAFGPGGAESEMIGFISRRVQEMGHYGVSIHAVTPVARTDDSVRMRVTASVDAGQWDLVHGIGRAQASAEDYIRKTIHALGGGVTADQVYFT